MHTTEKVKVRSQFELNAQHWAAGSRSATLETVNLGWDTSSDWAQYLLLAPVPSIPVPCIGLSIQKCSLVVWNGSRQTKVEPLLYPLCCMHAVCAVKTFIIWNVFWLCLLGWLTSKSWSHRRGGASNCFLSNSRIWQFKSKSCRKNPK